LGISTFEILYSNIKCLRRHGPPQHSQKSVPEHKEKKSYPKSLQDALFCEPILTSQCPNIKKKKPYSNSLQGGLLASNSSKSSSQGLDIAKTKKKFRFKVTIGGTFSESQCPYTNKNKQNKNSCSKCPNIKKFLFQDTGWEGEKVQNVF